MLTDKTAPIGTCDYCLGPIHPDEHYTSKGQPKRYCCRDCRNTANSRNGNEIRTGKVRERVEAGQWVNPRERMTPEQISATQSVASRTGRLREVAEGRWRNPGLTPEARRENSKYQRKRFKKQSERDRIAQQNLARPRPDARTNSQTLDVDSKFVPSNAQCVFVSYDAVSKTITLQFRSAPVLSMSPKHHGEPYSLLPHGQRGRISCVKKLKIPAGRQWRVLSASEGVVNLGQE